MAKVRKLNDVFTIWRNTHRDYRGEIDGLRCVLVLIPGEGTCSVPIMHLTDEQFADKLTSAKAREARGEKPYR